MDNVNELMNEVLELIRDLPQAKRYAHVERVKSIAEKLGLKPEEFEFVKLNVARWPDRANRRSTEIRFGVDFAYGDQPDHRLYGATFDEVAKLLRYTPESCRVAFTTAKQGRVDRTGTRQTRLGPCVVTKLPQAINPADYPTMRRLQDRENDLFAPATTTGGKRLRFKGNKY